MRSFAIIGFVSLIFALPAHAACDIKSFMNEDFSQTSEVTQLAVYSEITESQYKEQLNRHKGSMTIPYINVPAKGDFAIDRARANQVRKLLGLTLDSQINQTLISRYLTSLGVKAYSACLNGQRIIIDLPGASPTDTSFFGKLKWNPDTDASGEVKVLRLINATFDPDPTLPKTLKANEEMPFLVDRPNIHKPFKLLVQIGFFTEVIALPAEPEYELTKGDFISEDVSQNSDSSNGHGLHTTTRCFSAPDGAEFLVGSAKTMDRLVTGCSATTFAVSVESESSICVKAAANDCNKRGAYASGSVFAQIIRRTKVSPKSQSASAKQ